MQKYGIIGEHLSHTMSPKIYNSLFKKHEIDAEYKILEIPKNTFDFIVEDIVEGLDGFNVTIPYKTRIIPYLKYTSEASKKIGAVNVVNSKKMGFNTDWQGFLESVRGHELYGNVALVIGAGGVARAVCYALKSMGLDVYVENRTTERAMKLAKQFDVRVGMPTLSKVAIIVNATSLGMYPSVDSMPDLDLSQFPKKCLVYDVVYNPRPTKFLCRAQKLGMRTIDGYEMLIQQAILNLNLWSFKDLAEELRTRIVGQFLELNQNC